jgi:uncharacterized protein (TIGR03435 family)
MWAPLWIASDRYDIAAKPENVVPIQQMFGSMLQVRLEDRFLFNVHQEFRDLPAYTMTVARDSLNSGPHKVGSRTPVPRITRML